MFLIAENVYPNCILCQALSDQWMTASRVHERHNMDSLVLRLSVRGLCTSNFCFDGKWVLMSTPVNCCDIVRQQTSSVFEEDKEINLATVVISMLKVKRVIGACLECVAVIKRAPRVSRAECEIRHKMRCSLFAAYFTLGGLTTLFRGLSVSSLSVSLNWYSWVKIEN